MNPHRYREALEFALHAHNGQFRKGSGIPYITHPDDVLEDTVVAAAELEERFGSDVTMLVQGVTEEKRDTKGRPRAWEVRKEESLRHMDVASDEVVALKAADALHNVDCLIRDLRIIGDEIWTRFKRGRDRQLGYYRRLSGIARDRLGQNLLALELCEAVNKLGEEPGISS